MDLLTQTMAGAALGQAGLKKHTGLGMATLLIAVNVPDVDALSFLFGEPLAVRRGWTHGPAGGLALAVLLTAAVVALDRHQARRGTRPAGRAPVRPAVVLALAFAGILTHLFLDWLNTYGVRFLMPFSDRWFYGDAVFIIDPWIWLALGVGLLVSRRREKRGHGRWTRPAAVALAAVALYIGLMIGASRIAAGVATRAIEAQDRGPVERIMVQPVPANPFRREIIYDRRDSYGFGAVTFRPHPAVTINRDTIPKNHDHPLVLRAATEEEIRLFLVWARFPFYTIVPEGDRFRVYVTDARFARGFRADWATRSVVIDK